MSMSESPRPADPPPRAFTQGVGTVFQFAGVMLFLGFFFVCCFSGLLSKETATQTHLAEVGWGAYTAQRAISIGMAVGVMLGIALAAIGLGLQAQRRRAPAFAVVACAFAVVFWLFHAILFAQAARSILLTALAAALGGVFVVLLLLAIGSSREMQRNPTPAGFEILPADYKVPYSHLHEDPPEVRLARELEERRQRLAVQQKELDLLEEKLKRKMKPNDS